MIVLNPESKRDRQTAGLLRLPDLFYIRETGLTGCQGMPVNQDSVTIRQMQGMNMNAVGAVCSHLNDYF
jgi:hypothetical protein